MPNYSQSYITFSKDLMAKQGEDIKRWSQDSNLIIAREFQSVIDAAREATQ